MSEKQASPPESKEPAAESGGAELQKKAIAKLLGNLVIVVSLVTVLMAALIAVGYTYVAVLLMMGMLPAVVAHIVDRRPGKYASRAIVAFNIAGMLPNIAAVFTSGTPPNDAARNLLANPYTWFWVYMMAGVGWLIIHIIPQFVYLYFSMRAQYATRKMRASQDRLMKEWGEELGK